MAHRITVDPGHLVGGKVKIEGDRSAVEHVSDCYALGRVVSKEFAGNFTRALELLRSRSVRDEIQEAAILVFQHFGKYPVAIVVGGDYEHRLKVESASAASYARTETVGPESIDESLARQYLGLPSRVYFRPWIRGFACYPPNLQFDQEGPMHT